MPILAGTRRCTSFFARVADGAPLAFALAAIYGYESQTPSVAALKSDSFRSRYGLPDGAVSYFDVHATLDVEHATQLLEAMRELMGDHNGLLYTATRGAEAGAAAIWGLLDGVWEALTGTRDRSRFVDALLDPGN